MKSISSLILINLLYLLHHTKGEECDKLGIIIYEDIGCKPVYVKGKECPVRYECDLEPRNNTCLFRGHEIPVDGLVPDDLIYGNCHINCRCLPGLPNLEDLIAAKDEVPIAGGQFRCAILDCPEYFGGVNSLQPGCHRTYELNKCCATGTICATEENPVHKCKESEELTYLEGQKFYPPKTCLKCRCNKDFNGKFEEPHCMRFKCASQIRHQMEISSYCAPFYESDDILCCPDGWVCPTKTDEIVTVNPNADQGSDFRCKFGKTLLKLGEGLETKATITWSQKVVNVKCECATPPFLTCKTVK